jgi:hypothetical protein
MKRNSHCHRRSGIALIELAVSVGASSVLFVGLGSTIFLLTRANQTDIGSFRSANLAAEALASLSREAAYAKKMRQFTLNRSVEFDVADHTGDAVDDVVRSEWSGIAGEPLLRRFNGGPAATVLANIQALTLTKTSESLPVNELLASARTSAVMRWVEQTSGIIESNYLLDINHGIGTDFLPQLPNGTTSWSVSRVELRCQSSGGTTGTIRARLATADAQRKPATTLMDRTINESSLPTSMGWHSVSFSGSPSLAPDQRVCIVFLNVSFGFGAAMEVRIDEDPLLLGTATTWKLTTTNGGSTWTTTSDDNVLIRIFGTYTYPVMDIGPVQHQFNTILSAEVQAGSQPNASMRTSVRISNRPE